VFCSNGCTTDELADAVVRKIGQPAPPPRSQSDPASRERNRELALALLKIECPSTVYGSAAEARNMSSATSLYQASQINRRQRSTRDEDERRREALSEIARDMRPMTVRQAFHQASVRGLVDKTESRHDKVQTDLVIMRRTGQLPYSWLTDNTRWQRKPVTYDGIEEAPRDTARLYRKSLWSDADCYVEVWLEKDALARLVFPITDEYDLSLMVSRGYASLSFLHSAAEYIAALDVPICHLGDYDPSGVDAAKKKEKTLQELAPEADIRFDRRAVERWQISQWELPKRPTRRSDSQTKSFDEISLELDAIAPDRVRHIMRQAIEQLLPAIQFTVLREAEASEQAILGNIVAGLRGAG
jgi:hypothetical protein